jgi:Flp pilus assembly protein TadD
MALGLAWRDRSYEVDYSFVYPFSGIAGTMGSHLLGVSFAWGQPAGFGAMADNDGRISPEPPGKEPGVDTAAAIEARKEAFQHVSAAKERIAAGYYGEALVPLNEADRVLKNDPEVKNMLARVGEIAGVVLSAPEKDNRDTLLRKSVNKYIADDADAVNIITYASQILPDDVAVARIKEIIAREFPEAITAQRYLPGISVVDQLLQDALDLIRGGRFIQAVATLEKVLEIQPDNITALTRMGSAYWAMGKKDLARQKWKKVLELDPGNREVQQFMK